MEKTFYTPEEEAAIKAIQAQAEKRKQAEKKYADAKLYAGRSIAQHQKKCKDQKFKNELYRMLYAELQSSGYFQLIEKEITFEDTLICEWEKERILEPYASKDRKKVFADMLQKISEAKGFDCTKNTIKTAAKKYRIKVLTQKNLYLELKDLNSTACRFSDTYKNQYMKLASTIIKNAKEKISKEASLIERAQERSTLEADVIALAKRTFPSCQVSLDQRWSKYGGDYSLLKVDNGTFKTFYYYDRGAEQAIEFKLHSTSMGIVEKINKAGGSDIEKMQVLVHNIASILPKK